ncbi:hypothetical protein RSK20926_13054 [Roseobacter sp. SK209-2-6]|uniref:hypothetical protein n=1 Tax=Roseobacter sp. SK209-2-6 TaxID=388739 RepID=UPI0000F3C44C|nr:hypothetical protein [Roseobacter sp. SK209-2-6]EBA18652.1 hypothetical protein RSK20926_13054 [Roseobacter sp. SK209-2-6]
MWLSNSISIVMISTQMVFAADYLLQSRKLGLSPGALSMAEYRTIVGARFDRGIVLRQEFQQPAVYARPSAWAQISLDSEDGQQAEKPSEDPGTGICVRRGMERICE